MARQSKTRSSRRSASPPDPDPFVTDDGGDQDAAPQPAATVAEESTQVPPPSIPDRQTFTVTLRRDAALGEGTRKVGSQMCIIIPSPGVTLAEVRNALVNPSLCTFTPTT
jgi:hypothetical protein